jgi:hypothetical protein
MSDFILLSKEKEKKTLNTIWCYDYVIISEKKGNFNAKN